MALKLTVESFLQVVRQSGLVDKDQLQKLLQKFGERGVDVSKSQSIADALVGEEVITRWQAEKLLAGKHKGFSLGKYKLLDLLGKGGMSSVYLAEHVLMKRRCAIKVLPSKRVNDSSYLARFHREAQAVASVDHPNIVRAYDVDCAQDRDSQIHFLVMEYVNGQSLQELIIRSGPADFADAVEYIRQAAEGLEHAHRAGLVHRDIKPANLLIDTNGTIKLLDMGLARFFDDESENSLTVAHDEKVLGTADYLAPEQALDSHTVDTRADIYSLGCSLYFLLTGKPPYTEGTLTQRLMWHQTKPFPPLTNSRLDCPASLSALLTKMVEKKPEDRYQSSAEVADACRQWLNENAGADWKQRHLPLGRGPSLSGRVVAPTRDLQSDPAILKETSHVLGSALQLPQIDVLSETKISRPDIAIATPPPASLPVIVAPVITRPATPLAVASPAIAPIVTPVITPPVALPVAPPVAQPVAVLLPPVAKPVVPITAPVIAAPIAKPTPVVAPINLFAETAALPFNFSEPTPQFSEPTPQFSEPTPQFSEPTPQFSEPAPQFSEPAPQFSEPTPQPAPDFFIGGEAANQTTTVAASEVPAETAEEGNLFSLFGGGDEAPVEQSGATPFTISGESDASQSSHAETVVVKPPEPDTAAVEENVNEFSFESSSNESGPSEKVEPAPKKAALKKPSFSLSNAFKKPAVRYAAFGGVLMVVLAGGIAWWSTRDSGQADKSSRKTTKKTKGGKSIASVPKKSDAHEVTLLVGAGGEFKSIARAVHSAVESREEHEKAANGKPLRFLIQVKPGQMFEEAIVFDESFPGEVHLLSDTPGKNFTLTPPSNSEPAITIKNRSGVTIENVHIDLAGFPQKEKGILITGAAERCHIKNCVLSDAGKSGIELNGAVGGEGADGIVLENITFQKASPVSFGVHIAKPTAASAATQRVTVQRCRFFGSMASGIFVEGPVESLTIRNCGATGTTSGVRFAEGVVVKKVLVDHCSFRNHGGAGLLFDAMPGEGSGELVWRNCLFAVGAKPELLIAKGYDANKFNALMSTDKPVENNWSDRPTANPVNGERDLLGNGGGRVPAVQFEATAVNADLFLVAKAGASYKTAGIKGK